MAKRGRKPDPNKKKDYFSTEEEQAVIDYLNAETAQQKNEIYNKTLRPAFDKLVSSIIRRYRLYIPDEPENETFQDALSFILTKADKFKAGGKFKAYSYYGTICKNYLIGRIDTYNKRIRRLESYDSNAREFADSLRYSNYTEKNEKIAADSVKMLIGKIGTMIDNPKEYGLKDTEVTLGKALKTLLENWDFVLTTDGSNKLNKNAILLFLKETTGFDTKGIRDNMKKYKNEFYTIKEFLLT